MRSLCAMGILYYRSDPNANGGHIMVYARCNVPTRNINVELSELISLEVTAWGKCKMMFLCFYKPQNTSDKNFQNQFNESVKILY